MQSVADFGITVWSFIPTVLYSSYVYIYVCVCLCGRSWYCGTPFVREFVEATLVTCICEVLIQCSDFVCSCEESVPSPLTE